jgi:hypothetical protein
MESTKIFTTTNLGLAAFIVASKALRLARIDTGETGNSEFVFSDPDGQGSAIDIEFGTVDPMVPAASFHRALRSLRHMIDRKGPSSTKIQTIGRFNGNPRNHSTAR